MVTKNSKVKRSKVHYISICLVWCMVTEKIRLIGVASTILVIIVICNFHKKVYFPKVNPAGKLVAV